MHTSTLLHFWLGQWLSCIHSKRLLALFDMVTACVAGAGLSITSVGRRLEGPTTLKHKIKRADRLIGNPHLYGERTAIYGALCQATLARIPEPLILIDWSDIKADQSFHLLRASIAVGGHALTLYEEIHPNCHYGNPRVQERFLHTVASLLPPGAAPIVIADAGFKVPFFRAVEALGWRWVGRLRGRDYVRLKIDWISGKSLFHKATTKPVRLGIGHWVKSNPLPVLMVLVRLAKRGRHHKTAFGKISRSRKSLKAARSQREPWLLLAGIRLSLLTAKAIVRIYRQRTQIEAGFRDMKSLYFGQGFTANRSRDAKRIAILVLIAALAAFLLFMIGATAERMNLERGMHASSSKRRVYSLSFLASIILNITKAEIDPCEFLAPEELVAQFHQALLLDS
ncbi:IS4 family transposase [uncultured Thiodictyon sp.]|uniref:IS4 family transposase n=1 Tax=uncultured Thiodictyon sp. TaxID=1846217 RepID=UPI0025CC58F4|nr:IS4 family transposase [uncultured Thiodictyon sp.]